MRISNRLVMTCLLVLTPAVMVAAADPENGKGSGAPAAEKLRKALKQPVTVTITDQPLEAAIKQLKEQTKLNLVLDPSARTVDPTAVPGVGIAVPVPFAPGGPGVAPQPQTVTVKAKDLKLRDVLKTMLNGHNLTFAIVGDSVLIASEDIVMQRQLRQPVSVDLDSVPIGKALRQLARETGANLIIDPKLKKEADAAVTLQLDDVPLDTAVRLLCETAGLKPVRLGNVVYVTTKENAKELRADPDLLQPGGPQGPQLREQFPQPAMALGNTFRVVPALAAPAVVPPEPEKTADTPPKAEKNGSTDPDK